MKLGKERSVGKVKIPGKEAADRAFITNRKTEFTPPSGTVGKALRVRSHPSGVLSYENANPSERRDLKGFPYKIAIHGSIFSDLALNAQRLL